MTARAILCAAFALLTIISAILPVVWQLLTSLKPEVDLVRLPPMLPQPINWGHYHTVIFETPFLTAIRNSFVVAILTTCLSLSVGSLAAFALVHLQFPARRAILAFSLLAAMFPTIALISPLYLVINTLQLRDSLLALVLLYTAFATPLSVWILSDLFRAIPRELFQAARIDGCSIIQCFFRVILPLALPSLAATGILVFLYAWNEFLFALTFTSTTHARTMPVAIAMFTGIHEVPWGEIAAASILAVTPAIIFVTFFQKQIIDGLTAGAVKG